MREVVVGGTYKHFKGFIIKVLCVALDEETKQELVVYYHQNEENPTYWVRTKEVFLSEVDKEKHPDVKETYRFTLMED